MLKLVYYTMTIFGYGYGTKVFFSGFATTDSLLFPCDSEVQCCIKSLNGYHHACNKYSVVGLMFGVVQLFIVSTISFLMSFLYSV